MRIFTAGISDNSKAPGRHSGSTKYEMYILQSDFTALSNPCYPIAVQMERNAGKVRRYHS